MEDEMLREMNKKIDLVLDILNPTKNGIGIVAQVTINKNDIVTINKKPSIVKNILVTCAILINTALAAIAILK
jgi:hypothetical protein